MFGGGNSFLNSGAGGEGGGVNSSRLRYKCEECGKAFITPSKLQRHSYSHSGLRPFQCNICAKSFSQSANLKTHMKNTHPELFPAEEQSLVVNPQPAAYAGEHESLAQSNSLAASAFAAAAAAVMASVSANVEQSSKGEEVKPEVAADY